MSLDLKKIRNDFKILNNHAAESEKIIYFDNACTTLRPDEVVAYGDKYYYEHPACHNRAVHSFGKATTKEYENARLISQKFLNAKSHKEIIFLRNTTEAINLVARGLNLQNNDLIITTDLEHNSNLIPWQVLANEKGVRHEFIQVDPANYKVDLLQFKKLVESKKPKLVSVFCTSHVTGISLPIKEMSEIAHENGSLFLLDAAQAAVTQKLDVQDLNVDFLAFSLHKAFGPSGVGILYGKLDLLKNMNPLCFGGETVVDANYTSFTYAETPYRFEAGLQNYAGVMSAGKALQYISALGQKKIHQHVVALNISLTEQLQKINGISILGPENAEKRNSILNFNIKDKDMGEISILLDASKKIMTRSGFHCCHAWYHAHNYPPSLRVSFSVYNTQEEIEAFVEIIRHISRHY